MLVNADFKQLELLCAFYLSKDVIGYEEILSGFPIHEDNQKRLGLPEKVIAKIFVFRLIYGGTAGAYANDAEFIGVSSSTKYWQDLIDKFYLKYKGLKRWHDWLLEEVMATGKIVIPTGREWDFKPYYKNGKKVWPRTKILNYPVQGLGADLMILARLLVAQNLRKLSLKDVLLMCTVHDSVVLDVPALHVSSVIQVIKDSWASIPALFKTNFGVELDLPCRVEITVGPNWGNMVSV